MAKSSDTPPGNIPSSNINKSQYKKPELSELKKKLTPEQYRCTQESDTEKPFDNLYWNQKEDGIYVDVVTGEPLFSSLDKYDSGSGWPSFTKPIDSGHIQTKPDLKLGIRRVEILSTSGSSHLGHVFDDGPPDRGGQRFCVNSASLKFIPVAELKANGYGPYLFAFAKKKSWEIATLAGGCFWGVEELFRQEKGVIDTLVGYAGGVMEHPLYESVKTGKTGHAESVRILFDPKVISYEKILLYFFKLHDPTTLNQQGNDIGSQYRSAIFFEDEGQKKTAEVVKKKIAESGAWKKPLTTEITKSGAFWSAEGEHQKYLEKHPNGYTCHFVRKLPF